MSTQGESNRRFHSVSLALVLLLTGGCRSGNDWSITQRLWNSDAFTDFKKPAPAPHLELFADEAHADVLVIYDEARETSPRIRRRAFFVNQNLDRNADGRKPRFVSQTASRGLKRIPVLASGSKENLPSRGLAVLQTEKRDEFTLCADGRKLTTVTLPSYLSEGRLGKTLLTPLTVTGDTVMVATVVGLIAAWAYARNGGTVH